MKKTYKVSDLFKSSWDELTVKQMAQIIDLRHKLTMAKKEDSWEEVGVIGIAILRLLRKNNSLVSKINVTQAVDCLNDLQFIHTPWYHFPFFAGLEPDEKMHDRTFNQFIFADAEFTKFCVLDHRANPNDKVEMDHCVNRLIGIIYSHEFCEEDVFSLGKIIGKEMNGITKLVALHTFANVRQYIVKERCPTLFSSSSEEAAPQYTGRMWMNLRYELSETPTFQGLETTKNARLYDALDLMERKAIETVNLKRKSA